MGYFKRWIPGIFHSGGPKPDEVVALTEQFHTTLGAYITKVEEQYPENPPPPLQRIKKITERSNSALTWNDAYDIELQLVQLYDYSTLRTELERRLLDADQSLPVNVTKWYRSRADALIAKAATQASDETAADEQALLTRLINDLQWRYTRNEARRGYTKQITARTEIFFIISVIVFLAFFVLGLLSEGLSNETGDKHSALILFVGVAGAFGAAFSMMTSLKSRLADSTFDDLKLNSSPLMILARILVGIGAGFVLYFFVRSGLLGGDAFPKLDQNLLGDGVDFAKLLIWCFLAGFSEKLVPNLLSQTGTRREDLSEDDRNAIELPSVQPPPAGPDRKDREGAKPEDGEEEGKGIGRQGGPATG